ncbi:DUF4054 domain-containing protein [Sphingomonas sp. PB4P5]|uniref:DUF4054 domain-containing protein n=1 Tax=Parasphingomonas puruogangriensis TaxID=3096155 RepID=UPI002FC5F95B
MPYDLPTPANLKLRYAAFATVDEARVQYWLTDAERFVDTTWGEADYAAALMAKAADSMVRNAVPGVVQGVTADLPAGVTSFRSASFSATVTEAAANRSITGSNPYGAEFALLQRRNFGGPRLVGCVEPRGCC